VLAGGCVDTGICAGAGGVVSIMLAVVIMLYQFVVLDITYF
jgi:hypothetical protein